MSVLTLAALVCISPSLYAQTAAPRSVAVEAMNIVASMTTQELSACARAHVAHAERLNSSAAQAHDELQAAADKLRPQRAQEHA
jgi:hypothetical protein